MQVLPTAPSPTTTHLIVLGANSSASIVRALSNKCGRRENLSGFFSPLPLLQSITISSLPVAVASLMVSLSSIPIFVCALQHRILHSEFSHLSPFP